MKNSIKLLLVTVLVTVIGFSMVSCGTDDSPKGLAKQVYELGAGKEMEKFKKEIEELKKKDDKKGIQAAQEAYKKKLNALIDKFNKLSPEDRKIADEECERLEKEGKK